MSAHQKKIPESKQEKLPTDATNCNGKESQSAESAGSKAVADESTINEAEECAVTSSNVISHSGDEFKGTQHVLQYLGLLQKLSQ